MHDLNRQVHSAISSMMACKFVPLPDSSTPIFSFSISFPFSRSQGLREQAALVGVLDLAPASDDAADAEGLLAGIGQGGLHGLSLSPDSTMRIMPRPMLKVLSASSSERFA